MPDNQSVEDMRAALGRATWPYFFTLADYAPADAKSQRELWQYVHDSLQRIYYCKGCGRHGAQWMDEHPFDPTTDDMYAYMCRFKGAVDTHMKKTPRPCPAPQPGVPRHATCLACETGWEDMMSEIGKPVAGLAEESAKPEVPDLLVEMAKEFAPPADPFNQRDFNAVFGSMATGRARAKA
ncbi:MAG: ERV1/ALR-related protein [Euryarchaeota archaeon]|nr:ERV1/ALR-related protein [Euryarchaeota archaeon]MDE1836575.1 ERV1/ALR-related protein [Euryarchaeota archaeon]MDE1879230.1 ERV1/ALR-related protein [Euryarchaeota archaeon]MDE2044545.1 ERV1/ALR-related protein [Thermoplasmata archaeon]